jgi:hypothetical protein
MALGALLCCTCAQAQHDQPFYPPPLVLPTLAALLVIVLLAGAWYIYHLFFRPDSVGTPPDLQAKQASNAAPNMTSHTASGASTATPGVGLALPVQLGPMQRWLKAAPTSRDAGSVLFALAQLRDRTPPSPAKPEAWPSRRPEPRPRLLVEQGLAPALKQEVGSYQQAGQARRVTMDLAHGLVPLRLPADVEAAAFWIAREAIGNALRHPYAGLSPVQAQVRVYLEIYSVGLRLEVQDLGTGLFGPPLAGHATMGWPRDLDQHPSVMMMRQRAGAVGARLTLRSDPYVGMRVILRWLP